MVADACIAFYGLRFEVRPDETEALEKRSDPRMLAARKVGLQHYWGNFDAPGERYLLFVGTHLATLGPEDGFEVTQTSHELQNTMEATKAKLQVAGFTGDPSLYLQWEPDA